MPGPQQRPVYPLTLAAWGLSGLTLSDVWGRYLCLGGGQPKPALADYLDGAAAWPDTEHNVLAQSLDEGLWDLGLRLAPYRAGGRRARCGAGQPATFALNCAA